MATAISRKHAFCGKPEERSAGEKLLEIRKIETASPYQRVPPSSKSPYSCRHGQRSRAASHREPVVLVKTDGYTLSRSASKVRMNIQTATFFGENTDQIPIVRRSGSVISVGCSTPLSHVMNRVNMSKASNRSDGSSRDREMAEMQLLYENLQVEMTELKLNMDTGTEELQTRIRMLEDKLEEERKELTVAHEQEMENMNNQHCSFVAEMEKKHTFEIRSITDTLSQEKVKLEREVEFLEKSVKAMNEKIKNERESEQRLKEEEMREMKEEQRNFIESMEEKMKQSSSTEIILMKEKLTNRHKREMESLREEHKKEVDNLVKHFARIEQLEEEAVKNNKTIKKLEKKNSRMKQEVKHSEAKYILVQAQLLETETALENFKKGFQTKVKDVELKLKDRQDSLLLENSQLRKKLLTKTEEFCLYKVNVERNNARTLQTFKERVQVLLNARAKAKLGVALGISEESLLSQEESLRPTSAPSTEKESDVVRHTLLAAEEALKQQLRQRSEFSASVGK